MWLPGRTVGKGHGTETSLLCQLPRGPTAALSRVLCREALATLWSLAPLPGGRGPRDLMCALSVKENNTDASHMHGNARVERTSRDLSPNLGSH